MERLSLPLFRAAWLLLAGTLAAGAGNAWADQEPRALLRQGVDHFNEARFDLARESLAGVIAAGRDPSVLGSAHLFLGLVHHLSGRPGEACADFAAALAFDPSLKLDPDRFKPELVAALRGVQEQLWGELEVRGGDPGASVLLDARKVAESPWTGRVTVGRHHLLVRGGPGRWAGELDLIVPPGERVTVEVEPGGGLTMRPPRQVDWLGAISGELAVKSGSGEALFTGGPPPDPRPATSSSCPPPGPTGSPRRTWTWTATWTW